MKDNTLKKLKKLKNGLKKIINTNELEHIIQILICIILLFTMLCIKEQVDLTTESISNQIRLMDIQEESIKDLIEHNRTLLRPYVFLEPRMIQVNDSTISIAGFIHHGGETPAYNILSIRGCFPDTTTYRMLLMMKLEFNNYAVMTTLFPHQNPIPYDPDIVPLNWYYIHYLEYTDGSNTEYGTTFIYYLHQLQSGAYGLAAVCTKPGIIRFEE